MVLRLAAQQETNFIHLSGDQGLSQERVNTILEDSKGFVWVGNADGLNRYNGYEFEVIEFYHQEPEINAVKSVECLFEDSRGRIWIGTRYCGLYVFDYRSGKFKRYLVQDFVGLKSNWIQTITEDHNQNIWIGATQGGLHLYQETTDSFIPYSAENHSGLPDNDILSLYVDEQNVLWIGSTQGLTRLNQDRTEFETLLTSSDPPFSTMEGINAIVEDRQHNLWLGMDRGGLAKYNKSNHSHVVFKHDRINRNSLGSDVVMGLYIDSNDQLWIGTDGGGLNKLKSDSLSFEKFLHDKSNLHTISSNSVISIIEDRNGNLWFGNNYGGINIIKYKRSTVEHYYGSHDHFPARILSILVDRNQNRWIGTDGNGLNFFSADGTQLLHFEKDAGNPNSISGNYIQHLLEDSKGNIWIATYDNGLCILNNDKKTTVWVNGILKQKGIEVGSDIRNIFRDNKNQIWIGSNTGLYVISEDFDIIHSFPYSTSVYPKKIIVEIFEDSESNIWLGSIEGGLYVYKHGKFGHFTQDIQDKNSLCSNSISTISEDTQGNIWIGTYNSGISILSKNGDALQYLGMNEGLPSYYIKSILFDDDGNAWISTNKGLVKHNKVSDEIDVFYESMGLQGDDFLKRSSFKDQYGRLFFGGVNGYNVFHPEQMIKKETPPKILFTNARILNQPAEIGENAPLNSSIEVAESISLKYNQSSFSFDYTSIRNIDDQSFEYAYRLYPFESDWQYVGKKRTANYTNISPGSYTFELIVSDGINEWIDNPASIHVFIAKPIWQTWWAYTLYFIFGATALFLSYRYVYLWTKLKHNLAMEKLSREKEQEVHDMKLNFFTKISHEIRTPLTLIFGPIDNLIELTKDNYKAGNYLRMVKSNAQRLMGLTNQLIDLRKKETGKLKLKASKGDLILLLDEIIVSFKELARQRNINLIVNYLSRPQDVWFDHEKIEHIIFNLLSNAFKFTPDDGTIEVTVKTDLNRKSEEVVKIIVSDSGSGISGIDQEHIFDMFYQTEVGKLKGGSGIGLSLTYELVKLHHGKIKVNSKPQEGTSFIITLPMGDKHLSSTEKVSHIVRTEVSNSGNFNLSEFKVFPEQTKKVVHKKDNKLELRTLLIVEDNPNIRYFISHIFEDDFEITLAENGKKGLDIALDQLPDLIISDVMMPEMDGIEMTSTLKNDIRTCHIPIILLTARSSSIFKVEGLETGADDYITKPFDVKVLKLKVNNLLQTSKKMLAHFRREVMSTPQTINPSSPDELFIQTMVEIIEKYMEDPNFKVDRLARELNMSHSVLYRKCVALTGHTVVDFIRIIRLKKATMLLKQGGLSMAEIAYQIGFSDTKYFSKCFKKQFGKSPSAYLVEIGGEEV
ncbi:two-component regulator propeller domain-containing protein [Fulvivirgaceae bacterium BMA10]|uniref:histidine kinase n=1 Tax=Splendidivirga corallicola TaxID=3051826 RepID=A0ABT8KW81_9BACT|nr:two-component regulator propeller domain-containing protein [Fulvivirgaceae bacterium BMA10]